MSDVSTAVRRSGRAAHIFAQIPGLLVCVALAIVSIASGKAIGFSPILIALVIGIAVRTALNYPSRSDAGVQYASKSVLRIGVALLGFQVIAGEFFQLGMGVVGLIAGIVLVTLAGGYCFARMLRLPNDTAAISSTSVAICGASAALAASTAVPNQPETDRTTTTIIIVVSILSTVVMVVYPKLAEALGYDAWRTSFLLGAAIHDVAQVAGAGLSVSDKVAADAITIKMIRVALLLPTVVIIGLLFSLGRRQGNAKPQLVTLLPPFLIAFFIFALAASAKAVPSEILPHMAELSRFLLTVAVVALGLKTSLRELARVKPRLLLALTGQTALQLVTTLILIQYFLI